MIAIIEAQGKQYLIKEGSLIKTNKIKDKKTGDVVDFDKVLLLADSLSSQNIKFGKPYISGAKVEGKITREFKKKTTLMKFRSKTREKTKKGYKSYFNNVEIVKIHPHT